MTCQAEDPPAKIQDVIYCSQDSDAADRFSCYGDSIMKISVWEHSCGTLIETVDYNTLSTLMKGLNISSLCELRTITEKGVSSRGENSLLCCFLKANHFVKGGDKVVKAFCSFREICSNGSFGSGFKTIIHGNFAHQLYEQVKHSHLSTGDVVMFVNPLVFFNPGFKANANQPYILETGSKETEKIGFYKLDNGFVKIAKDCIVKWLESNLPLCSAAGTQEKKMTKSYCQVPKNITDSVEPKFDVYVILISLEKPTKTMVDSSVFNLLSGYCLRSCHQMCHYQAIVWNKNMKALCPTCWLPVDLNFCMLFCAMLVHSQRLVNIVLTGKKADSFLEVSCHDFLNDQKKRDLALKALESKYVKGSEYKACTLTLSEVSNCCYLC